MSIQVEQLTKIYDEQRAVNEINFSLTQPGVTGFLGPNGAGKSTTMKMLTGYLTPTAGRALVCGIDVQQNPIQAKRSIGYLPESNALYYDMYVKEYLHFIASVYQLPHKKQAVEQAIEQVGLQPEYRKKTGQLSKGYKQRVGIAAAIIHNPPVLILDEPTSGLDPNQIMDIRRLILRLGEQKTVLLSTHIMQEVSAVCNHVIIINKGNIVANDTLEALSGLAHEGLLLEFAEKLHPAFLQQVAALYKVEQTTANSVLVYAADSPAIRKTLMEQALQHNLTIAAMRPNKAGLQEIFHTLTTA